MTALDRLAVGRLVTVDDTAKPTMVTVHSEHGPRNYPGRDIEDACTRALAGMRKETQP